MKQECKAGEKTVISRDELLRMAQTDPLTVDRSTLVDIHNVRIKTELDKEERILDFIRQIKNPYCYLDRGMVVKISFSGSKGMEDCLRDAALE